MPKSTTRLSQKCTNKECCKAFCRQVEDFALEKKIVKILSKYGDSLNCRKILKSDFNIEKNNGNILIDSMIYTHKLLCESKELKSEPSNFSLKNTKIFKKIAISEKRDSTAMKIKPCQELHHKFCSIMNLNLDESESFILVGVIHFLLKKFEKSPDFNLAVVIVRYFNILTGNGNESKVSGSQYANMNTDVSEYVESPIQGVTYPYNRPGTMYQTLNQNLDLNQLKTAQNISLYQSGSSIDKDLYPTLLKCFELIADKVTNSLISSSLPDHQTCQSGECLLHFNLSKSDFKKTVKNLNHILERSDSIDFRDDQKLISLFKTFEKLHLINQKMCILDDKSFILNLFYLKVNLKNELKFLKLKFDTPLRFFFTIPVQIKAELLKIQNSDLMKVTLQEAFFKALFEGATQPYLFISIRRDKIYQDTLKIISTCEECDIRKQLKVKFNGEEGIDSGGIKKEFFLLLGHEIENDISLFTQTNNRMWFKNGANREMIESIGRMVGIALYNDVVLNVPFPSMLFKKLLGIPLLFEDLEEIEPEIFNSLKKLESCTEDDLIFLDQNFTVDFDINGVRTNCELFTGGRQVKVTKSNLSQFSLLYFKFLTNHIISQEFDAFSRGFHTVVKSDFLRGLSSNELEKMIIGCDEIDFEIIKKNAIYNGYSANSAVIESFWKYFASLKLQKKKKLIQFITGNDRLPVGGSDTLNLVIMKNGCDTDRLPSSQTCFNTLLLPEYSTAEKLEEKMNRAIDMTAGFFLM